MTGLLTLLLAASLVSAETVCGREDGPTPWSYCLTIPAKPSGDLLYYFHGGGGSERNWDDAQGYGRAVARVWRERGFPEPAVAAVSFGPSWLLGPPSTGPAGGLMNVFLDGVMPRLESRLGAPRRRLLAGESMGGFNAAQLVLVRPAMFEGVALVCPGIGLVSPHASGKELRRYRKENKAAYWRVRTAAKLARRFFPTPGLWAQAAPLENLLRLKGSFPRLYVSCGKADEYGFFNGALRFVEAARGLGARAEWVPLEGGHCAVDPGSLAVFLGAVP